MKLIIFIVLTSFELGLFQGDETTTTTTTTVTTPTTTTKTTTPPAKCFNPYCICFDGAYSDQLLCEDFDSFEELDFTNEPDDSFFKKHFFSKVTLKPNSDLIFDDRLDLTGVNMKTQGVTLELWYLKSFALGSNPLSKINFQSTSNIALIVKITNSRLSFYYNDRPVNSECDTNLPLNASLSVTLRFGKTIEFKNVEIEEPICPYVFRNVDFQTLKIEMKPNSRIEFLPISDENTNILLNSKITNFIIENSHLGTVDAISNVLNYDIHYQTKLIQFSNTSLGYIHPDTFFNFKTYLNTFKLGPSNWEGFLKMSNKWMDGLNANVSVDVTNTTVFKRKAQFLFYLGSNSDLYWYPDEDFCYFKDFPHYRLVLHKF